ncbi:hypothetical protein BDV96DRAFT_647408 [Lophiotrema nucula]|uniref:Mid2 domain-containing protein n=1 Tax=Lophiotrema nucula TaxID=690887 RepID=A0A6A5Z368_9PLEO|nr:hypothetical protein BDV96DRAFT_647408 [Lophiotrema nucula]
MCSFLQTALAALFAIPLAAGHAKASDVLEFLGPDGENATIATGSDLPQVGFMAGKVSNLNRKRSIPRGRDLFARQACTYQESGSTLYCNDPSYPICCQWTDSGTCCPGDTVCAASKIDLPCRFSVSWITIYETSTDYTTEYSTDVSSVASTTEWTTEYSTTIEVETRSDVSTATEVKTLYITVSEAQKRALLPTVAPTPPCSPIAAPSPRITSSNVPPKQHAQKVVVDEAPPKLPNVHAPLKRTVRTEWSTTTTTTTDFETSTVYVTSIAYYTETSTTSAVVTSTSTSALNAKTTVTQTTTSTYTAGRSPPPPTTTTDGGGVKETQVSTPNNSNNNGSGLSTGAKIGIGAGTGAGSLLICIILAFWLHRRRKSKKQEVSEMINAAVAAANANNQGHPPPQPTDAKMPVYGVTQSPPPPVSPYQGHDQRFSDPIPVYESQTHSPAPVYRYPSPGGEGWQGHEMAASPVPQHQQPYHGGQPQMGQLGGGWTQNELPTQRY